jgi:hypothetical protein
MSIYKNSTDGQQAEQGAVAPFLYAELNHNYKRQAIEPVLTYILIVAGAD